MSNRTLAAAALALVCAHPANSDEFTDVVEGALEAYEAGEFTAAREDLDYAIKILAEMKSEGLAAFLPDALPGWERGEAEAEGMTMGLGMLGGGTAAAAKYSNPDGELTISLITDSPMLASFSAMFSGLSSAAGGKPIRIQRVQFIENDGELQGIVENRILVSVTGDASLESKKAYLEALDIQGLKDF
ncbi:hypothetical protein [Amaricoccus macauensis]|uniref:hypothetical protein n=1 Tax=Amaricoccus macauensis TaxID=57001 RepID=UPI003C7BA27B